MALKVRRGTDAERAVVVFEEGEIVYTTDQKTVFIGDGTTPGGVPISAVAGGSPPSLTQNLDGDGFDITGVDSFSANTLSGDASGLTNVPAPSILTQDLNLNNFNLTGNGDIFINGEINAGITNASLDGNSYRINVLGTDSTIIVDSNTGILTGDLVGSHYGDVYSDNSNLLIDANRNVLYIEDFQVDRMFLGNPSTNDVTRLTISGEDNFSTLRLTRNSLLDIEPELGPYGRIDFQRDDLNGAVTVARMQSNDYSLNISHSKSGNFNSATGKFLILVDGKTVVNGPLNANTLDTSIIADFTSYGTAEITTSLETPIVYTTTLDTTDSSGITVTPVATFESDVNVQNDLNVTNVVYTDQLVTTAPLRAPNLTTAERDALSPGNGDIIYNTTDQKFQGYENGAWANLI